MEHPTSASEVGEGASTLHTVARLAAALPYTGSLAGAIDAIVAACIELTGADGVALHLCDGPSLSCRLTAHHGISERLQAVLERVVPDPAAPFGRAMATGEEQRVETTRADEQPPVAAPIVPTAGADGFHTVRFVPLVGADGQSLGLVLLLHRTAPHLDPEGDLAFALYHRQAAAHLSWARANEQLRQQDLALALTLDASSGGTWSVDFSDHRVSLDGRTRSPFWPGPPGTDLLHDVLEWVPDEDRLEILAQFDRLRREPDNDHTELEFRVNQPDGSMRWVHGVGRAERDATGALVRVGGIVVDITERKQRELEARDSSSKLEAALAAMTDAVFILDNAGNFLHFNDAFVRFCRFPDRRSLLATVAHDPNILELTLPDGQRLNASAADIARAARGEAAASAEYTIRRTDTGESWIGSFSFAPIRDDAGVIVGSVVTARDITEQRQTQRRLVESEARLRSIIATAADAIVVIDEVGTIESVNHAVVDIFGYPAEELIGRNVTVLMPPNEHDRYLAAYRRTGERRVIGFVREVEGRRRDGSSVALDLSVAEWFDGDGRRFFTGLLRDISERKRTEQALALSRRLEAVGQLAAGVAHDFNNLLTVISGNLELVEGRTTDERTRRLLRRALDAVEVGASFNRKLLSLAQRRTLEPRRVLVGEQVHDVLALLERTLGEHIELVTSCAADLWPTEADPGEIDSALLNLVMNARDALADGGRIEVRATNEHLDGDYVCLSVIDSGSGMAPDVLDRALEPFFTTKAAGAGSGLGLSSVSSFAHHSGGFLRLESTPGVGTTARLYLPRAEPPAAEDAVAAADRPGSGELVLVVEDDDALREMTLDRLESLGYSATGARSGPEAIERLQRDDTIRAVLSDIVMPGGMNGFELAEWVAAHVPRVQVVLSSGYSEQARPADAAGLLERTPYLPKPYTRQLLAEALASVLGRTRD